jgi:hypothetical protein
MAAAAEPRADDREGLENAARAAPGGDGDGDATESAAATAAAPILAAASAVALAAASAEASEDGAVGLDGVDALFAAVDRNGDGGVSRRELMLALNAGSPAAKDLHDLLCHTLGLPDKVSSRDARSAFELAFDCLDRDGSGAIDQSEMRNFVSDMVYIADLYRKQKTGEGSSSSSSSSSSSASEGGSLSSPSTPFTTAPATASAAATSTGRGGRASRISSDSSGRESGGGGGRAKGPAEGGSPLPLHLTELDPHIVELLARTDLDGDGHLSNVEIIRAMRNHREIRDLLRVRELERATVLAACGAQAL